MLASNALVKCVDDRACVDSVYTDLNEAFDSISHIKLVHKLRAYGISNNFCGWIEQFLSNRLHRIIINDSMSDWLQCTSGVPQGRILGPKFFLIYVNDLPQCVLHSQILLHADNAKLFKLFN